MVKRRKTKIDRFNLHFNPEKSIFLPDESTIPSKADWATSKNTVVQDFNSGERINIYNLFGDRKTVKDEIVKELGK